MINITTWANLLSLSERNQTLHSPKMAYIELFHSHKIPEKPDLESQ